MPDLAELHVLHWNVHSWIDESGRSNLGRVANLIAATDPDIVSLVEVNEPVTGSSPLDELASISSYRSVFTPSFEYGTDEPQGRFGNAVLSRLPLLDVRHHQLIWPPRIYDGTEPSEPRSLLLVRVQAGAEPMWVAVTHLPSANRAAREVAARRALSIMAELAAPWILVGDFNTETVTSCVPTLPVRAINATATYPASSPSEGIDYCVVPLDWQAGIRVLNAAGSDHLPILVSVRPGRVSTPPQDGDGGGDPSTRP